MNISFHLRYKKPKKEIGYAGKRNEFHPCGQPFPAKDYQRRHYQYPHTGLLKGRPDIYNIFFNAVHPLFGSLEKQILCVPQKVTYILTSGRMKRVAGNQPCTDIPPASHRECYHSIPKGTAKVSCNTKIEQSGKPDGNEAEILCSHGHTRKETCQNKEAAPLRFFSTVN